MAGASHVLSLYLLAGALGGFLGGHLSDRVGGRRVILISMAGSVPFLVLFFLASGRLLWRAAGLLSGCRLPPRSPYPRHWPWFEDRDGSCWRARGRDGKVSEKSAGNEAFPGFRYLDEAGWPLRGLPESLGDGQG